MKTYLSGIDKNFFMVEGSTIQSINCGKKNKKGFKFKASDGTKGKLTFKNNHWSFDVKDNGHLFERIYKFRPKDIKFDSISDVLVLGDGINWIKINGEKYIMNDEVEVDHKISFDVIDGDMLIGIGGKEIILSSEGVLDSNRQLISDNFINTEKVTFESLLENFSEKTTLGELREIVDLMNTIKNDSEPIPA